MDETNRIRWRIDPRTSRTVRGLWYVESAVLLGFVAFLLVSGSLLYATGAVRAQAAVPALAVAVVLLVGGLVALGRSARLRPLLVIRFPEPSDAGATTFAFVPTTGTVAAGFVGALAFYAATFHAGLPAPVVLGAAAAFLVATGLRWLVSRTVEYRPDDAVLVLGRGSLDGSRDASVATTLVTGVRPDVLEVPLGSVDPVLELRFRRASVLAIRWREYPLTRFVPLVVVVPDAYRSRIEAGLPVDRTRRLVDRARR